METKISWRKGRSEREKEETQEKMRKGKMERDREEETGGKTERKKGGRRRKIRRSIRRDEK